MACFPPSSLPQQQMDAAQDSPVQRLYPLPICQADFCQLVLFRGKKPAGAIGFRVIVSNCYPIRFLVEPAADDPAIDTHDAATFSKIVEIEFERLPRHPL